MKVCLTRNIPGPAVRMLQNQGLEVSLSVRNRSLEPAELLEFVKGADALLCLLTDKIDAAVFTAAGSQLRIVSNLAVGFDNIDLAEASRRGIAVTNTPSPLITDAVAEHTLALILALAKKIVPADRFVREGKYHGWDPNLFLGPQLSGKTLGVVGLGRIGLVVARLAMLGLGMKIVYASANRKEDLETELEARFLSLSELLPVADFVSLHVPLTMETERLLTGEKIALMRKTAYLINTSRGSVVDEAALVAALKEGAIAGAALDVFEDESRPHPDLWSSPNVILTPHIASATIEAREEMGRIAAENIIAVLTGKKPLNPAFISQ